MIKTPLSTVIGGAFWTPGCTVIGGSTPTFDQQIQKLFANGEQGFYYDPNDLSTLYQDAAGTIPVTAAGQPVGLMLDKSGRNNHAYQSVSASRPILQRNATTGAYYLAFDGADDYLRTASINFASTDKISLVTAIRKLSDAGASIVTELSVNAQINVGSFYVIAPIYAGANYAVLINNGVSAPATTATGYTAPTSNVISARFDTKGVTRNEQIGMRVDGVLKGDTSTLATGGNFGNYPLFIGRRAGTSLAFSGHVYGLIAVSKLTSDDELTNIEKDFGKRIGVTLNV
jgi:hypothetical protein